MGIRLKHISRIAMLAAILALPEASGEADPAPASNRFYRALETADGLPDNSVTGLVQASDGYLWVATGGGLMRFNGASLTNISLRRFPEIGSQAVRTIFFDRHGQLWVAMERGPVVRLGRHGGRAFTEADGLFPSEAMAIAEDGEGTVWIAFAEGICRFDGDVVTRFTESDGLPKGDRTWVGRSANGPLWFARGGSVGIYQDNGFRTLHDFKTARITAATGAAASVWICVGQTIFSYLAGGAPAERGRLPEQAEASVMFEDRSGALWIGTVADGLFRLAEGVIQEVPTSNPDIKCISQDREGNIWAGTNGGGLNLIRSRAIVLVNRNAGLPFESVISVCEDLSGRIWAVGESGGLARRDAGQWIKVSGTGGKATCVASDIAGDIWLGTQNRGLGRLRNGEWQSWKREDGLASDSVRSLLTASNGDVWIAMDSPNSLQRLREGVLTRFEADEEIGAIPAMAEGTNGEIWIGTEGGGIYRTSDGKLVEETSIVEKAPVPVRSLLTTPDGSLWIGYAGDGLGWLKGGSYARITSAEGLMDDYISQLQNDGHGSLWISANRGIFQVDLKELLSVAEGKSKWVRSRVYGRSEGLPVLQPNRDHHPSTCLASNGHLWFSMRSGLVLAQPEKIRDNPDPPAVLLERVDMDDQAAALYGNRTTLQRSGGGRVLDLSKPDALLRLPPGHNKLKFDFAALSFASPENVHFRYRLKNFDRDWVEADTQHSATYPRLPGGKYEFQVIACNNAGVWNETGASLPIVVAPFFWETWWFKTGGGLGTVLVAGGGVYLSQRRRHRAQLGRIAGKRAIEEERARIARDIHDDLGASLTRIMLMSRPGGDGPGNPMTTILPQIYATSRNLIRSMAEVVWAVNPEQDTFDGLADYMSNYAQGFLGLAGIRCRLEMPLKLPDHNLSAQIRHNLFLAFKEALNNVVKHSGATEVRISLIPGNRNLVLRIEDNGKGIGPESGNGNGLANMKKRLEEIGGSCVLKGDEGTGTRVEFEVQLRTEP